MCELTSSWHRYRAVQTSECDRGRTGVSKTVLPACVEKCFTMGLAQFGSRPIKKRASRRNRAILDTGGCVNL